MPRRWCAGSTPSGISTCTSTSRRGASSRPRLNITLPVTRSPSVAVSDAVARVAGQVVGQAGDDRTRDRRRRRGAPRVPKKGPWPRTVTATAARGTRIFRRLLVERAGQVVAQPAEVHLGERQDLDGQALLLAQDAEHDVLGRDEVVL